MNDWVNGHAGDVLTARQRARAEDDARRAAEQAPVVVTKTDRRTNRRPAKAAVQV
jgi:hypothetical protein